MRILIPHTGNSARYFSFYKKWRGCILLFIIFLVIPIAVLAQRPPIPPLCDTAKTPGTLPATAIPICDKGIYYMPHPFRCVAGYVMAPNHCRRNPVFPPQDVRYPIFSPIYYRFKCYASGTFAFVIVPYSSSVNLDWQLYDITGIPAADAIKSTEKLIAGNWSTNYGHTGTETPGIPFVICQPIDGAASLPAYSEMPELIAGHEYLLLVANPVLNTEDYTLRIEGGTADIRDPLKPRLEKAIAQCNGKEITLRLNKDIKCSSLTATGSEFSIVPAGPSIVSARSTNCTAGANFTELTITLSSELTTGSYQLVINDGSDGNTLVDFCDIPVPTNERAAFEFEVPVPLLADSIAKTDCQPNMIQLYFPKRINCSDLATNGSQFTISGPEPVTIRRSSGICIDGKTESIKIDFNNRIQTKGIYTLTIQAADDGTVIVDECGLDIPAQTINFTVADTVNADFTYDIRMGCRQDTLQFNHNGAHDVNYWRWKFNDKMNYTQNPVIIWPAKSDNIASLVVSNGTCADSVGVNIKLDNEVIAKFDMDPVFCPEDKLVVKNQTIGDADRWTWRFDVLSSSVEKDPSPVALPLLNREAYYSVKLIAHSTVFGCSDSTTKTLTVLDHCYIAVPSAFTPNNDGLNDYFSPHNALKADNYEFKVFNRQGQLVFHTRNWRSRWDGRVNGVMQNTGVYIWMLNYINKDTGQPVFQKGTVALIR